MPLLASKQIALAAPSLRFYPHGGQAVKLSPNRTLS
jgi:hypothetical protein